MLRLNWEDEARKAQKRIGVLSLSIDNTSGEIHNNHFEALTSLEAVEMSATTDSTTLLKNSSAEFEDKDNNAEAETAIDDDESEKANMKFESEAGASLSSSQKRTLFFKKLSIAVVGVLLVAGAGVASNFTPLYAPRSDLCDSNLTFNSTDTMNVHISICSGLFSTTSMPLTSLQYSLPHDWRPTSTLSQSAVGHFTSVIPKSGPRPSPVMSLHSSRQPTDLPFRPS